MYHYLKWAALGYFIKKRVRYLLMIAASAAAILLAGMVYDDLADLATRTGTTGRIVYYLIAKWSIDLLALAVAFYGLKGLFQDRSTPKPPRKTVETPFEDPIMKRLERFKTPQKLKRRSEIILRKKSR
jgi:hypothetical protein